MISLVVIEDNSIAHRYDNPAIKKIYAPASGDFYGAFPRYQNQILFAEELEDAFLIFGDGYETLATEKKATFLEPPNKKWTLSFGLDTRGKIVDVASEYEIETVPQFIRVSLYWNRAFTNLPNIGDVSVGQLIFSKVIEKDPFSFSWGNYFFQKDSFPQDYSQSIKLWVTKTSPSGTALPGLTLFSWHSYYDVWPEGWEDVWWWPGFASSQGSFIVEYTGYSLPLPYGRKDLLRYYQGVIPGTPGWPLPYWQPYTWTGIYAVVSPV